MAIGAVVGAAVLSALLYLLWRRGRQRPKGRPLIAQRKERLARFSYSNPLLRGKQLPKPPKGSPPMHSKLSFEEFQRKPPCTDTFATANPLVKGRKGQRS